MSLSQILENIPLFNRANDVLVCEADTLGMRASVLVRQGGAINVTLEAHAEAVDLTGGVTELVQQLRKQGWSGNHAILLNPAVVQQLIDLPIPPKNKLAPQQIAESVRWELEPFVSQQNRHLFVGQILLNNRQISAEKIDEILNHQEIANSSKNREVVYKRFGELAVELGYASRNHVDKALSRQSCFIAKGDELHCGWAAVSDKPNADTQLYTWLAVGVNKQLLRQWQAAFSSQGVKLEAAYPLVGNAIALTPALDKHNKNASHSLMFELTEAQMVIADLFNGQLKALQSKPILRDQALNVMSDLFHSLGVEQVSHISLYDGISHSEIETNRFVDDAQHVLGQPISAFSRMGHSTNQGLKAAAMHYFKQKTAVPVAAVPVGEPQAPLMQRPEVRAGFGVLILLGLLGLAEASLQVRHYVINSEKEVVDKDLAKIKAAIARLQAKVDEVKKLKDGIKEKQDEIKELNAGIKLISADLPKRNKTINDFLDKLDLTVSEDVVIDHMVEDTILGYSITAWAINEKSAQEFVKDFQIAVHDLGYKLKDITVTQQTGRLSLLGSAVNFNATTLSDEAWKNAKQNTLGVANPTANTAAKGGQ